MRTQLAIFIVSAMLGSNDLIGLPTEGAPPLSYAKGRAEALAAGKDLVVGIACDPPAGPWLGARVEEPVWPGTQHWGTGVVVLHKNKGKWFEWIKTMDLSEATSERITALLGTRRQLERRQKAAANC